MDLSACPHCGVQVVAKRDGTCPACGQSFGSPPQAAAGPDGTAAAVNPFDSPSAPASEPEASSGTRQRKEPVSLQAAKFSAYAPFIVFLLGFCVQAQFLEADPKEAVTALQVARVISVISLLTIVAAIVLGVVGLVGGIQRGAAATIVYAVVGLLLNSLLIALTVSAIRTVREVNG